MPHFSSVKTLTWALIKEPRQIVYLPDWWRVRRRPPDSFREPWWPRPTLPLVASRISPGAAVFEYGSGGSTHWLTSLGARVTSVEHDPQWYETVASSAANVILRQPTPRRHYQLGQRAGLLRRVRRGDPRLPEGVLRSCDHRWTRPSRVRPGGHVLRQTRGNAASRRLPETALPPLSEALRAWPRIDIRGLKPRDIVISQTTIWTRPS